MAGPLLLGIEIGGTKLQLGLGRGDGRIVALHRAEIRPGRGAAGILASITEGLDALIAQSGHGRPAAAGIGFGGPVDAAHGVILKSNHVDGWDGFALALWAMRSLRIPVALVHNDSDVAALAEARFGAGRGVSPVLYVNSGSGVGGGLVIEGRIYRGGGLGAVEIGHLVLGDPDGPPGATLEDRASGWAIARAGRDAVASGRAAPEDALALSCGGHPDRVTGELVGRAAVDGDPAALAILDRAARAMGAAIGAAANLIAPARVVLGGGVSQLPSPLWLDPIRLAARERTYGPIPLEIHTATLGQEVVVQGALAIAADAWTMLASG
jgi:glucokinase